MMPNREIIPLCRAEFLQDISIELGRRFALSRHPWKSFWAEVNTCGNAGESLEKLTVWATTDYGTGVNLTLWADTSVWVSVHLSATPNNEAYRVGFYSQCDGFTPADIAEAFRDTVSVSTRLC